MINGQSPRLALKGKGWIASDPREFIKWFNKHADKGGQLKRIVRYLKAWSDFRAGNLPSGLIFTILAANNFSINNRDDVAFYKTLLNIKENLNLSFNCYRPTTPVYEDLLANYSRTNKDYFMTQLDSIIECAQRSIDDTVSQPVACNTWQRHLGPRFPCDLLRNVNDSLLEPAFSSTALTFPNHPIIPKKPGGFA